MTQSQPTKRAKVRYRGSDGDLKVFAPRFIEGRMKGFEKDLGICLAECPQMIEKVLPTPTFHPLPRVAERLSTWAHSLSVNEIRF